MPSYWQKDDHDAFFDDCYPGMDAPWIKPLTYADGARVFREQTPASPTAIVGPDNADQADNHANEAYRREGNEFRQWTHDQGLTNLHVVTGDRHWQYLSTDPRSGLREFGCGPASDTSVLKGPGFDPNYHSFYRPGGGFASVGIRKGAKKVLANPQRIVVEDGAPIITLRLHDVDGKLVYEYRDIARSRP